MGNDAFKKQAYHEAIEHYTDAISKWFVFSDILFRVDIAPHEAMYSNRAASLIQLKEFNRAMEDCQAALRLNPDFARIYKRQFKAQLALGYVAEAKKSLATAIEKDPLDKSNKADLELMDTVFYQQKMIDKFGLNGAPDE